MLEQKGKNSETNMAEETKAVVSAGNFPSPYYYGTFQGVTNYNPPPAQPLPQEAVGFPHTVPPPAFPCNPNPPFPGHGYYGVQGSGCNYVNHSHGYHAVPVYAVVDGRPMREDRLPCCGLGMGWFLFILGFFLSGIPWYVGALVLLCSPIDHREKPGYVACTIAAVICTIAMTIGAAKGAHAW